MDAPPWYPARHGPPTPAGTNRGRDQPNNIVVGLTVAPAKETEFQSLVCPGLESPGMAGQEWGTAPVAAALAAAVPQIPAGSVVAAADPATSVPVYGNLSAVAVGRRGCFELVGRQNRSGRQFQRYFPTSRHYSGLRRRRRNRQGLHSQVLAEAVGSLGEQHSPLGCLPAPLTTWPSESRSSERQDRFLIPSKRN